MDLPFFPKFKYFYSEGEQVSKVWFEKQFSQNGYNYENLAKGSNACTLIAVLMANYCENEKIILTFPDEFLNKRIIYLLAFSILEGNKIYDSIRTNGLLKHNNLNVPEAIKHTKDHVWNIVEWKSLIFMQPLLLSLYKNIQHNYLKWKNLGNFDNLYIILLTENRSILFILQEENVALIDSHHHAENKGACIAISSKKNLKNLCLWCCHLFSKYYKCSPDLYELSFLYFPKLH